MNAGSLKTKDQESQRERDELSFPDAAREENASNIVPSRWNFRLFLQEEFLRRCKQNPQYSLRAYAKFLRIDPSTLSQILRGKRAITENVQFRLGQRLGLGPIEMAAFWKEGSKRRRKSDQPATTLQEAQELTLDAFQVIADWYHYAIFELITLKDFSREPKWIARKLGISVTEANIAIERLIRLGLITVHEDGSWKPSSPLITTTSNPFTAVAFRKLQAQVLSMAMKALENIPMELRDQSSMSMAINTRRLPEAKERIKKFRRELCDYLQQDSERDAVYQLGVSFYPLTLTPENENKGE